MKKIGNILKSKIFIIINLIILFIFIILFSVYFMIKSSLKINGSEIIEISYNEDYKEFGATFKILNKDLSKYVKISNNIVLGKIGNYKVTYEIKYLFFSIKEERKVIIVDKIPPVLSLNGENSINVCPNKQYEEEGYKAIDEYDGDITDRVIINTFNNQITYQVSDNAGNKEKVTRQISCIDEEAPKLSLKGSKTIYIRNGAKYIEYGYEVLDNCDEDVKVIIDGSVDTSKDGTYTITYTAEDSSGNKISIKRDIIVYTDSRVGVVYLTFDDGPSGTGSTEKILNILKEENVKATFFVTGNGPDYLIKMEYDEGHTVALHTNTHNYAYVYSSVDNYYNDLNKVSDRVYNITGVRSNIIRFPGGSNNTVSNRYSNGIMDILVKDVIDKGYIYFDWNISSGDAGSCTTSSCVYNNVVNNLSKNKTNMVLMHDIKMFTANAVKDIIEYCKQNGYALKAIDNSTYQVKFK